MLKELHQIAISLGWVYVIGVICYILGFGSAIVLMAGQWENGTLKEINLKRSDNYNA